MLQLLNHRLDLRSEYTYAIGTTKPEIIDTGVLFTFRPWLHSLKDLYTALSTELFTWICFPRVRHQQTDFEAPFFQGNCRVGDIEISIGWHKAFL